MNEFVRLLDLNFHKAREFFLKENSYNTQKLPPYYKFQSLLNEIAKIFDNNFPNGDNFQSAFNKKIYTYENVNYLLYANKDGNLSLRELQLINPIWYVYLVFVLTTEENWRKIQARFQSFQSNDKVLCVSIPLVSQTKNSDQAAQIFSWWKDVEQHSIELALDFDYLFETDIADCYGSIYTHAIAWAIETKKVAKEHRDKNLLGNRLDNLIQSMQYGQTNGIPQGSILMDFIAEIVLGYMDEQLSEELKAKNIIDYKIIRYRDDYRIFVNDPTTGTKILKILAEKLMNNGMRLNNNKTKNSSDVITSSIKPDKLNWWLSLNDYSSAQRYILAIREHSKLFPNSGTLIKQLDKFYDYLKTQPNYVKAENIATYISIVTDILRNNPRVYPSGFAIISILLNKSRDKSITQILIKRMYKKLLEKPNTGYMEIWFKRVVLDNDDEIKFTEKLCNLTISNDVIWNIEWLNDKNIKKKFKEVSIIDKSIYAKLEPTIRKTEFELFSNSEYTG